jgi:ribosome-associated heat shock protein Hsp15
MDEASEPVRVDRWLWAARFVKTRALAVEAVKGGRVQVNGQRIKPSKELRPGDRLEITLGRVRLAVVVSATALRRGPAGEAKLLYEETAESREARERQAAERSVAPPPDGQGGARPTKRERRRFDASPASRRGRR